MLKAFVKLEPDGEQDESTLNCVLPQNPFIVQSFAKGGIIRPVAGIVQKIDPTKPLGKIKMTVETKFYQTGIRGPGGSVRIVDGQYVTEHFNSSRRITSEITSQNRQDPTKRSEFREKINSLQIQNQMIRAQNNQQEDEEDSDFEEQNFEVKGIGLGTAKTNQQEGKSNLTQKELDKLEKMKNMNDKRRVGFVVDIPQNMR